MMTREVERKLLEHYGVRKEHIKKAFDATLVEGFAEEFKREGERYAVVMFLDIARFSRRIKGWPARDVADYLDQYYSITLPIIAENHGKIDRIVGDGIVAVFSPFFHADLSNQQVEDFALNAAEEAIRKLYGGQASAKAALGLGNLLFCKTGVSNIYEEYTAVGHPLTMVYRLEAIAEENALYLPDDSALAQRERQKAGGIGSGTAPRWFVTERFSQALPGIGETAIYKQTFRKPQFHPVV
jgi:class 3 adenylate cyclase